MALVSIEMKKEKSTKRFDVYLAKNIEAVVQTVYVHKSVNGPSEIILSISAKE